MATWLVTGGTGFLGRHLLAALGAAASPSDRVVALGRRPPDGGASGSFVVADLLDPPGLRRALDGVRPDFVVHAAGRTPPADPAALYRSNTGATRHLLGALGSLGRAVRVVLVGSAAELGPVPPRRLPIDEECPCRPADAYGLSKWAATRLGLSARGPVEVVVARVFNPIGPGQPPSQAFGRFASRLAGAGPGVVRLEAGDLEARRDFHDVRDAASAVVALAGRGRAGRVYHVGSGASRRVGEGLEVLVRLSGREVEVASTGPVRGPTDSRAAIGRIAGETGWSPRIAFERSLADLWAEVRARARPGSQRVA